MPNTEKDNANTGFFRRVLKRVRDFFGVQSSQLAESSTVRPSNQTATTRLLNLNQSNDSRAHNQPNELPPIIIHQEKPYLSPEEKMRSERIPRPPLLPPPAVALPSQAPAQPPLEQSAQPPRKVGSSSSDSLTEHKSSVDRFSVKELEGVLNNLKNELNSLKSQAPEIMQNLRSAKIAVDKGEHDKLRAEIALKAEQRLLEARLPAQQIARPDRKAVSYNVNYEELALKNTQAASKLSQAEKQLFTAGGPKQLLQEQLTNAAKKIVAVEQLLSVVKKLDKEEKELKDLQNKDRGGVFVSIIDLTKKRIEKYTAEYNSALSNASNAGVEFKICPSQAYTVEQERDDKNTSEGRPGPSTFGRR